MHKIIFITDKSERDRELVRCLNMLFPECDIEIRPKKPEGKFRSKKNEGKKGKTIPLKLANIGNLTNKLVTQMKA